MVMVSDALELSQSEGSRFAAVVNIRCSFPSLLQVRLKMAETIKAATKLIEQGHVRVGPQTVTEPAMLITR